MRVPDEGVGPTVGPTDSPRLRTPLARPASHLQPFRGARSLATPKRTTPTVPVALQDLVLALAVVWARSQELHGPCPLFPVAS